MKNESDVTKDFKRWLILSAPGSFFGRVENSIEPSWPDAFVNNPAYPRPVWVEFKYAKTHLEVYRPDYRPGQLAWAKRYTKTMGEWRLVVGFAGELFFMVDPKLEYTPEEVYAFKSRVSFWAGCES